MIFDKELYFSFISIPLRLYFCAFHSFLFSAVFLGLSFSFLSFSLSFISFPFFPRIPKRPYLSFLFLYSTFFFIFSTFYSHNSYACIFLFFYPFLSFLFPAVFLSRSLPFHFLSSRSLPRVYIFLFFSFLLHFFLLLTFCPVNLSFSISFDIFCCFLFPLTRSFSSFFIFF
ncbi:SLC38A3 [Acanthosepion pharaonis]|uniref:SLC38A3 n=1 Tax=Acanthosepion pharaonis TaxID=158019 RepID=A0A812DCT9_ACAPH|nr:SLC38A3 [Sepia pharaonis]